MNVVFVSNYYTHHQAPFAQAMARLTGGRFTFAETEPMEPFRLAMGWPQQRPDFVLGPDQADARAARIRTADLVIHGGVPYALVADRLRRGGLTLQYSERIHKLPATPWRLSVDTAKYLLRYRRHKNAYLLCVGGWAAADFAAAGADPARCYRWGYYPPGSEADLADLAARRAAAPLPRLLWAGRLIDWKHPEAALALARSLARAGYAFQLDLIGDGPLAEPLRKAAAERTLAGRVRLLGAMPPAGVLQQMEQADIFLATSDRQEGWGAVISEAMSAGCALAADCRAGAAPFLIRDGENGLLTPGGDAHALLRAVTRLLEDDALRTRLGAAAQTTVRTVWSGEEAARRLLLLAQDLADRGSSSRFADGPCSPAPLLPQDWQPGKAPL